MQEGTLHVCTKSEGMKLHEQQEQDSITGDTVDLLGISNKNQIDQLLRQFH